MAGMPPPITASTGLDAFFHAVEGLVAGLVLLIPSPMRMTVLRGTTRSPNDQAVSTDRSDFGCIAPSAVRVFLLGDDHLCDLLAQLGQGPALGGHQVLIAAAAGRFLNA